MDKQNLKDVLALQQVPKVGPVLAKSLIAYCGSAGAVFSQKRSHLLKIPGIGQKIADNILHFKDFDGVEKEINFIEKHKIQACYYLDKNYPHRLKELPDAPLLVFYKGNSDLNQRRVLGVVGTRKATDYGKAICEKMIEELAPFKPLIVSGLAYGIDYMAHKAALKYDLETVGVLGHGLDNIYPSAHRQLAVKMLSQGGLLTEYTSGTKPDREHFPARNRIVAGLIDGLLLVETTRYGGALITAEITNSYNREVFAVPGRTNDEYSAGCNHFIKVNKAYLVEQAADIAYHLGWESNTTTKAEKTSRNYEELKGDEKKAVELLREKEKMDIDSISSRLELSPSDVSMLLLELEFKGIVQALPGKVYRLV